MMEWMLLAQIDWKLIDDILMRYGVGVGALAGLLWIIWKLSKQAGTFLSPIVTRVANAHISLVEELKETSKAQAETSKTHAAQIEKVVASMRALAGQSEKLTELNERQANCLEELSKANVAHTDPHGSPLYEHHIFSTVATNKAVRILAQVYQMEINDPVKREKIQEAIDALKRKES